MSQLSPAELLFQLKSFASNPPKSLNEDVDLCNQLYYAAQEAMVSFENSPKSDIPHSGFSYTLASSQLFRFLDSPRPAHNTR